MRKLLARARLAWYGWLDRMFYDEAAINDAYERFADVLTPEEFSDLLAAEWEIVRYG